MKKHQLLPQWETFPLEHFFTAAFRVGMAHSGRSLLGHDEKLCNRHNHEDHWISTPVTATLRHPSRIPFTLSRQWYPIALIASGSIAGASGVRELQRYGSSVVSGVVVQESLTRNILSTDKPMRSMLFRDTCANSGREGNDYAEEVTLVWTGACGTVCGRRGVGQDIQLYCYNFGT